jgi:hypothetical protein
MSRPANGFMSGASPSRRRDEGDIVVAANMADDDSDIWHANRLLVVGENGLG